MSSERLIRNLNKPVWPYASMYSIMASALAGGTESDVLLSGIKSRKSLRYGFEKLLPWDAVIRKPYLEDFSRKLGMRTEAMRLSGDLDKWFPAACTPWIDEDEWGLEELRFCEQCAVHAYHCPLMQFPWMECCPLHGTRIRSTCPRCDAKVPIGLSGKYLGEQTFRCRGCQYQFWDAEHALGLTVEPKDGSIVWRETVQDFFIWKHEVEARFVCAVATQGKSVRWARAVVGRTLLLLAQDIELRGRLATCMKFDEGASTGVLWSTHQPPSFIRTSGRGFAELTDIQDAKLDQPWASFSLTKTFWRSLRKSIKRQLRRSGIVALRSSKIEDTGSYMPWSRHGLFRKTRRVLSDDRLIRLVLSRISVQPSANRVNLGIWPFVFDQTVNEIAVLSMPATREGFLSGCSIAEAYSVEDGLEWVRQHLIALSWAYFTRCADAVLATGSIEDIPRPFSWSMVRRTNSAQVTTVAGVIIRSSGNQKDML